MLLKRKVSSKNALFNRLLIAVAVMFLLSSCTSAEEKCYNNFNDFVNTVEQNASNYTAQDWQACTEAYETYVQDLDACAQLYTPEQNREIGRMKARYHKVVLKYYLNCASNFVNNMSYQMERYADEMGDTDDEYNLSHSMEQLDEELNDAVDRIADILDEEIESY